jgi:hypothetical protein
MHLVNARGGEQDGRKEMGCWLISGSMMLRYMASPRLRPLPNHPDAQDGNE